MKLIILGLDGAEWHIIQQLLKKGDLPNIRKVMESGVWGVLNSTIPAMTPLAWTSIVTGCNPGKHGIYDFIAINPDDYSVKPVNLNELSRATLLEVLNATGKKTITVNFPMLYPPLRVENVFISGIPALESQDFTYPLGLKNELLKRGYQIHAHSKYTDGDVHYLKEIKRVSDVQIESTLSLLHEFEWDLVWLVLMGLDWAQHYFWTSEGEKIENLYRYFDEQVGRFLELADRDTAIMLVSDHGGKPIEGEIYTNSLLEEWGYLYRSEKPSQAEKLITSSPLQRARQIFRLLPVSLKKLIRRNFTPKLRGELSKIRNPDYLLHQQIDWEQTRAFALGAMGRIYVNSTKRFPRGLDISQKEYQEICMDLISRLKALKHPSSGVNLIDRIYTRDDVYKGDCLDDAPDIIFDTIQDSYSINSHLNDKWLDTPGVRCGDHTREGIFILAGPEIARGEEIEAINSVDIMPTILGYMDLPIPDDLDGIFREDILDSLNNRELRYTSQSKLGFQRNLEEALADSEVDVIEQRLKDLGYL